ncbi:Serine-aspartate repeat-containing protein D precursor [Paenibacillus konkukensis]|uniref:Serine-aspartate repeat-containing protein D n=1 Tax=Paenibacillus konkukensis TaxID=2020716 RepID=A0ABY4RH61_9BACL|nr:SdrD B-like domain-containing protein [Paenibacillus konkukensis]UQZ81365.1 Serine-aspartate repeat-containing protein D precursor [Paenibacillus konkukensis]
MRSLMKKQALLWVLLLLANVLLMPMSALAAADASDGIQIEMRSSVSVVDTGNKFTYDIDYSVSSTTQMYANAQIVLPLPGALSFDSAVDAGDTEHSYDAGNHTVTFKFKDTVKAGTTGTLQVNARFPNYKTPNRMTVSAQSKFESDQGGKLSNIVQVTSRASAQWELKKERSRPAAPIEPIPGSEVEYQLTLTDKNVTAAGKLELQNVTVRDTLPRGAQFVSAQPAPERVEGGAVIWSLGSIGEGVGSKTLLVKVKYPSDMTGDAVNRAEAVFTPLGEQQVTLNAEVTHAFTSTPKKEDSRFLKWVSDWQKEASPGQTVNFYIGNLDNGSNVALQNYELTDMTPDGLELNHVYTPTFTGIAAYEVQYTTADSVRGPWVYWGTVKADQRVTLRPGDVLPPGTAVKGIKFIFGEVPVDFGQTGNFEVGYRLNPSYAAPVTPADSAKITNTAQLNYGFDGKSFEEKRDASFYVVQSRPLLEVTKKADASNYSPGDKVTYRLSVRNTEYGSADFRNPIVEDLLPAELDYIQGSAKLVSDGGLGLSAPNFEATADSAPGRTLLRWSWDDANPAELGRDKKIELEFQAVVKAGAKTGYIDNEVQVSSDKHVYLNNSDFTKKKFVNGRWYVYNDSLIYINSAVKLESVKWVQGDLDGDTWTRYPNKGLTTPGGKVEYKLVVTNVGNIPVRSLLLVDALPRIGDRGVVDSSPRGSEWSPVLTGKVSAADYITVLYTTDATIAMSGGHWSAEPPADLTTVTGIQFVFEDGHVMAPGAQEELRWTMRAPVNAPTQGQTAWSSFGFMAKRADNGKSLLATEPLKVGVAVKEDAKSEIGDYVWNDLNGDGIQNEPAEQGVNGVHVELYTAAGSLVQTTITGNDHDGKSGYYMFTNLESGSYKVKFILPQGYGGWTEANEGGDHTLDSDAAADGMTGMIQIGAGEKNDTVDAGLIPPAGSIGDTVWSDLNGDGLQDAGEPGVDGITVNLYDKNGYALATAVTSGGGHYMFSQLTPGDYAAEFILPSGAAFTVKGDGSKPETDSDANADGKTDVIRLDANQHITSVDAGLILPSSSLGDRVWIDENGNGTQDAGEPGLNGVAVRLFDEGGTPLSQTTTVKHAVYGDGYYQFDKLPAGSYIVQFELPDRSYEFTQQGSDLSSETDSNANPADGRTQVIRLRHGESNQTVDAGLRKAVQPPARAAVGDYVWIDENGDGIQNDGNAGLNGVVVRLFDDKGALQGTAVTASVYDSVYNSVYRSVYSSPGYYRFDELLPGRYAIKFELPSGYEFTQRHAGSDASADSDAGADGMTDIFDLASGETNLTIDAGARRASQPSREGVIGDYVWIDANGDGIQNDGETGLNDVPVKLYGEDGNLLGTTVTGDVYGGAGAYRFEHLEAGAYTVRFELPSGYEFTRKHAGNNGSADSDANADGATDTIILVQGETNLTVDAGLKRSAQPPQETGTIGDYVWVDANRDGLQSDGETGLNGLFVHLYGDGGLPLASTVTGTVYGKAGYYSFTNVPAGTYSVKFDLPSGYEFTGQGKGGDRALDSDADAGGITGSFNLAAGETNLNVDAGLVPVDDGGDPGSGPGDRDGAIGDYVWIDTNNDGIQNSGEAGLSGVQVKLFAENGNLLASTVTGSVYDKPGYYIFDGLQPGKYYVTFELPSGYQFTLKSAGTDRSVDSDAGTDGKSDLIALAAGERNLAVDAGLRLKKDDGGPSDPGDSGGDSGGDSDGNSGGGSSGGGSSGGGDTGSSGTSQPGGGSGSAGGPASPGTQPDTNLPGGDNGPTVDQPLPGEPIDSAQPLPTAGGERDAGQPGTVPSGGAQPELTGAGQLPLTGESLPAAPLFGIVLCICAAALAIRWRRSGGGR